MAELSNVKDKILQLKKEKNALILAHFYMPLEVQSVADYVCDSFEMAKKAKNAQEDIVVICGVEFMGESAKILSPGKKVLLPVADAGCPMADMITRDDVLQLRSEHPNAKVMCYVNSSADVKAVSDICCTSSSALRIARSLDAEEIIFIPDRNLGSYIAGLVPEKVFIFHEGHCPVHNNILEQDVLKMKAEHPNAKFAVHPECRAEVVQLADFVGSTSEIIEFAAATDAEEIIIGTECEITARLARDIPGKRFYTVTDTFVCEDMKKVTLESVLRCLETEEFAVTVDGDAAEGAGRALDRMVKA